ncbi:MAG: CoA transferase [Deltaproteobacteria bacterium]|nr:CoA transferase [Deltaproteobacteria bacterium]MBW2393372.1 CoA transferase [Deltaproteobacteria bacterium]
MNAPLADVRVVEIASFVAAPAAGALLADLGAEVIKVEVPGGETLRHARPKLLGWQSEFSEAPQFHMDNRGKRSLVLDLRKPEAREALLRVIDSADVVLTNMLPGRLTKYGLDPESLRERRPELVVASLTGYGKKGAEADTPAFDYAAYWARTGMMDLMREPDAPPAWLRPGVGDHAAALALTTGILSALRVRDRTGQGQLVDVNLMHIGFYVQGNDAAPTLATGTGPLHHDRNKPRNPLWSHYPTRDDRWVFLVMIESDRYWPALCRAIGKPELETDERFDGARARYRNSETLAQILRDTFLSRSLAEWEKELLGHTIIWSPVRTLAEAVQDPEARANGVFAEVEHPTAGTFETVAPPLQLSGHAMPGDRPAPELGADGADVLCEAGLSEAEIAAALETSSG